MTSTIVYEYPAHDGGDINMTAEEHERYCDHVTDALVEHYPGVGVTVRVVDTLLARRVRVDDDGSIDPNDVRLIAQQVWERGAFWEPTDVALRA